MFFRPRRHPGSPSVVAASSPLLPRSLCPLGDQPSRRAPRKHPILPEPSGGGQWPKLLSNQAQSRLGPIAIRFSTSDTYPTKNRNNAKNANREGGASFVSGPSNRYVPLVKGPKKAVSGGKMVDLGGQKRKTRHLRDWRFSRFSDFW